MISKVLFGHDPETFFQSIKNVSGWARKRTFRIMSKVIFKIKNSKLLWAWSLKFCSGTIPKHFDWKKCFGIVPEKELLGSCPNPFVKIKFKKILWAWSQKFFSGTIPKHFDWKNVSGSCPKRTFEILLKVIFKILFLAVYHLNYFQDWSRIIFY